MNKNNINIPTVVFHPDFSSSKKYTNPCTYKYISFYKTEKDANNEKATDIELPDWLSELIKEEVKYRSTKAVEQFKKQVAEMFK